MKRRIALVKPLARNSRGLSSFIAMDVMEAGQRLTRQGHHVINFSLGEPDFPAPPEVKAATIQAIQEDFTKYTHSLGMPELREAICAHYRMRYKVRIDPEQVLVTNGTSPAMLLVFGCLLNPGDEVILSDPHYPCYSNFIRFFKGKIIPVNVHEKDGFQLRAEAVQKKLSPRTKILFLNSPSNPTGCTLSGKMMKQLASLGKIIVSDEIYHGLTYTGEERSILEFTDRAFVLNGFSKSFSMTGFRLGYLIAPKAFVPTLQKMQQNFYISTSSFIQAGGLAALQKCSDYQAWMREKFNERRKIMLQGVRDLGFRVAVEPTAAFYIFANARHYTQNSHHFAFELLNKAKVGVTPGIDFGKNGEGFIRFSYATGLSDIREGLNRIGEFLRKKRML